MKIVMISLHCTFSVSLICLVVRMLLFCPTCSNVLTVEEGSGPSLYRFACQTCPYVYNITKKVRIHVGILHIFYSFTVGFILGSPVDSNPQPRL